MIFYLLLSILIGSTFSLMVKSGPLDSLGKFITQIAFGIITIALVVIVYGINHSWHIYLSSAIWIFLFAVVPTVLILYFREHFVLCAMAILVLGFIFLIYGNFHKFVIKVEDIEIYSGSIHKILTLSRVEGANVNMFILSDLYRWGEQSYILEPFRRTLTVDITGFIYIFASISSLVAYWLPLNAKEFKFKNLRKEIRNQSKESKFTDHRKNIRDQIEELNNN